MVHTPTKVTVGAPHCTLPLNGDKTMETTFFKWVNQQFIWSFLEGMLNYKSVNQCESPKKKGIYVVSLHI